MRSLGIYRHAAASLNAASPEFRTVLESHSAGIDAFLHSGKTLPVEFTMLGYRPENWTPADSLVIGKLLALQPSGNYRQELPSPHYDDMQKSWINFEGFRIVRDLEGETPTLLP